MAFYHFGVPPFLSHQVPQAELPDDELWAAPTQDVWRQSMQSARNIPTITSAISQLFYQKQVKAEIGEFGRILLLHGVYHELHQVRLYFQRPMSMWTPGSARPRQDQAPTGAGIVEVIPGEVGPDSLPWLSETPHFAAWRNAALDCVDVLHWWANGIIALQSGIEHPTVFHLHFSRTVLLVPVQEIMLLVTSITNLTCSYEDQEASPTALLRAEKEVIRWSHQDEV